MRPCTIPPEGSCRRRRAARTPARVGYENEPCLFRCSPRSPRCGMWSPDQSYSLPLPRGPLCRRRHHCHGRFQASVSRPGCDSRAVGARRRLWTASRWRPAQALHARWSVEPPRRRSSSSRWNHEGHLPLCCGAPHQHARCQAAAVTGSATHRAAVVSLSRQTGYSPIPSLIAAVIPKYFCSERLVATPTASGFLFAFALWRHSM